MKYKHVMLTGGQYDDYTVHGFFRVPKDLDVEAEKRYFAEKMALKLVGTEHLWGRELENRPDSLGLKIDRLRVLGVKVDPKRFDYKWSTFSVEEAFCCWFAKRPGVSQIEYEAESLGDNGFELKKPEPSKP